MLVENRTAALAYRLTPPCCVWHVVRSAARLTELQVQVIVAEGLPVVQWFVLEKQPGWRQT